MCPVVVAVVTPGMMAVSMTAHAFDWYGGLSAGQARHEVTGGDLVGPGFTGTVDGNDTGWKVFVGMALWDKYVGAEFGYANLGEATAKGRVSGSSATATSEAKAYTAAFVGLIPVGDQFGVILKLGLDGTRTTLTTSGSGAQPSGHTADTKIFGGFGFQYDFSKSMGLRLEAERFNMGSIGSPYVNLVTAGLVYRLGK